MALGICMGFMVTITFQLIGEEAGRPCSPTRKNSNQAGKFVVTTKMEKRTRHPRYFQNLLGEKKKAMGFKLLKAK